MSVASLRAAPAAVLIIAAALALALALVLPGYTITTVYLNDLFIFIDGAHRVASGQVPNRDFHTALGPVVYYLPALGYWLSGDLGGAMPVAMALLVAAFAPIVAHVLGSRLRPAIAVPFGLFVLLILAVPVNLGESIRSLSFAMFYNRIGWAALAVLMVLYVRPLQTGPRQVLLDALCAASLTVLMLYTKVTYGIVAFAFLVFMLLDCQQRRSVAGALALTTLAAFVVELIWQSSAAHVADLLLTSRVSGARGHVDLALGFLRHLADYLLFAMIAVLALWRRPSLRDALFFGFCAGVGLLIMNQNSQPWGIITLHAGAAVGAEMAMRSEEMQGRTRSVAMGTPVLLLALVLPTAVHCVLALGLHTALAATRVGEPFGMPRFDRFRLALLWAPGDRAFSNGYLASIHDGARVLNSVPEPKHVSVLDFANPFSAGLGLPPPRGDNAWLHWGRNVNAEHHIAPERLLSGVELLMEPKWGINNVPLSHLYGDYFRAAFEPIRETEFWVLHRRRAGADGIRQGAPD